MTIDPDKIILSVGDLLSEAQTQPIDSAGGDEVDRELEAKLKDARARRDAEWGLLANQVVGGETGLFPEPKVACQTVSDASAEAGDALPPSSCCGGSSSS